MNLLNISLNMIILFIFHLILSKILEGLGPYGGQTSSSCGGLMAFVHLFYGFGYFFIHHGTPIGSFTESFVKIRPDLAEIRIRKLDWCDGGKKKGKNPTL